MPPLLNIAGQRFNRLIAVRRVLDKHGLGLWECRCDCGRERRVRTNDLRTGSVESCGCLNRERIVAAVRKHGCYKTREYAAWLGAKNRCYNPKKKYFWRYGGRGIAMCDRWRNSFVNFLADMGPRPQKHSLDRIDNDGNYEPGNCRWATQITQKNNTCRSVRVETPDGTMTIAEAARFYGLPYNRLWHRVSGQGLSFLEARAQIESVKEHAA